MVKTTRKRGLFTKKAKILELIKAIFEELKSTYGLPRIYAELGFQGVVAVAKYMRELGLDACLKKKYRIMTTDSNHKYLLLIGFLKLKIQSGLWVIKLKNYGIFKEQTSEEN